MENEAPVWAEQIATIEDTGLKETLSKYESPEKFFEAIKYTPPVVEKPVDWREQIKDEDVKKFVGEVTDINALGKRALEMRQKLSSAIIKPGKDATPEQVTAYRKAMGIPETPDKYDIPVPEGAELTDAMKAERKEWSERFHKLGIPAEQAKALWEMVGQDNIKAANQMVEADKKFAKDQDDQLKAEWGSDYGKNKTLANRAFSELAARNGLNVEDLTKIETKDGRFLMDRADIVRMFAAVGREMAEGTLGSTLTESEIETVNEQIETLRKQQSEAQAAGNSKKANDLYQKEQALIAKRDGSKAVVGSGGRAV